MDYRFGQPSPCRTRSEGCFAPKASTATENVSGLVLNAVLPLMNDFSPHRGVRHDFFDGQPADPRC
jgi:hypothetical protein